MRILMVTMALGIGGAETHILELTRELCRRGHDVTVAAGGGIFVEPLTASGARFLEVPMHSKRPQALLGAYRTLCALLRRESFDVIHAHARIPGFIASILAKKFDIPLVTTFHGTFNPVWYWRMLTRVGERTLAVSEDVRAYLKKYYAVPDEKIAVTVNGIDTASFAPVSPELSDEAARELSLPAGRRILAVTRLDAASAWHVFRLIESMPAVRALYPDACLVIVGGGDVLDEVQRAADAARASLGEDAVTVLGPRSDIACILSAAEIFAGVSRAAMEAMACEKPVVLTGAQGHMGLFTPDMEAEAIETNFCCRTRAPGDTAAVTEAVLTALSLSPEKRTELGQYGRALVSRLYSVSRMAGDAEEMYRRATEAYVCRRGDCVISGYYGFSNAGDDALLAAIAGGLRERGVRRISALAKRGAILPPGVKAVSRFNFPAVLREISHARVLVSGGGSLLQDATSTKSLLYYTAVIRYAHFVRVPVMILANGIGPLSRPSNRRRAARAARLASYISVREGASGAELVSMGIPRERIRVTADPVYRMGVPTAETENLLVLSLRETADGMSSSAVEEASAAAIIRLAREENMRVVLLSMQPMYDHAICSRVTARLRAAGIETELAEGLAEEPLRRLIASARAVVAMRLHALIFASAAAVPCLALSYDPKIDALMDSLGMSSLTLPSGTVTAEALEQSLRSVLTGRETYAAALREKCAALATLAQTDLDRAAEIVRR